MTKMKKFLALLASLTAVATLGLATACGDKGDSSTPAGSTPPASTPGDSTPDDSTPDDSTPVEKKYTITVKKPDGTPAAGIWIQTCVGDNCSTPAQADENGVFVFEYEDDATVYHVTSINGDDFADFEAVDFNTVPGTAAYEITLVAKAPAAVVNTVADVYAGENNAEFTVTGTILANSGKGFVLADATGSVFVYETCTANVGDVVTVKAVRATFGNCVQLKTATIEAAEGTAIQAGAIKELTAADCDAYKAATLMTPEYASFEGTLSVSQNKYFNIAIEGTEVIGSIVTPTDADKATLAELNGKKIKVEGYVVYVSSGKYLYSVATSITEVVEAPSIATPVSGTGTFEDAYVIEAGKTYVASKDAQDSVYFTMTNAQAGTYTFNLAEGEGMPTIEIDGLMAEIVDGTSFVANAGATVNIMINNSDWGDNGDVYFDTTFSVDFVAGDITPDGSALAPIALENGVTYTVGGWKGLFYTFTAPSAGQYKLSLTDWATQVDNFNFFDADYNTFNRGVAIDIAEGETITFKAYSYLDDASTWTFSFAATLENDTNFDSAEGSEDEDAVGTENNPFAIEAVGDYEITVAAGATYYAKLAGGAFQFVVPEGVKVFLYGENSGFVEAGTLVAFTNFAMWNQEMYFDVINEGEEDVTITLSVVAYVAPQVLQVGNNDVVIEAGTEGLLCKFTAYVTGQYTFKSQAVLAKVFSEDDVLLGTGVVALEAGKTYIVRLTSPMGAGSYTLTIEAPAEDIGGGDEGEGGGENEDGTLVLAVGANTVTIDATNNSVETGVACYFTPEVKGKYQFKGDLMAVVYDENGNDVAKASGKYTLNANETYIVVFYNFMPNIFKPGDYTITVELKEEIKDEPAGGEVVGNGTVGSPYVIEDIFAPLTVADSNANTQIVYTFTLTEAMNLTFTFDSADTWFYCNDATTNQGIQGSRKEVFTGTFAAGTYKMGIGNWTTTAPLTLTVTGEPVGSGSEEGDVVTYLGAAATGSRKMQVAIDAANGTITVTRSDYSGVSLDPTYGASVKTGTYSFDGTTVTCEVSGCTFTWNADGSPATINWGGADYTGFTVVTE